MPSYRFTRFPRTVLPRTVTLLAVAALGSSVHAGAQTTPAATPPASTAPTPSAPSSATTQAVSSVAVDISAAVRGQIVSCPAALKLSPSAVCLYAKSGAVTLRPLIKGRLAGRAVGEWKTAGKASTLLVTARAGAPVGAFVLLSALADQESLVVVDSVQLRAAPAAPKMPAGVTRGQPYVLGSDLAGVVKVTSLGAGKFKLSVPEQPALTVTVGQRKAQTEGGSVELPLAPATDGKNLIFPVSGLRALGCTVTPAGKDMTVACGPDSIGLRPIVF
ncbi:hypothetical protein [Deinococcus sp.]|uniref:hypothetical protein n=1 Tax=Deinococcus sp. TaxID=47478 RepID=UPI002869B4D7|nr:hypothetical protein [Deinococcus sp.]